MALTGASNLDAANKAFITAVNDTFGDKPPGTWDQFTTKISASGTSVDLLVVDGEPQVREWLGAKQFFDLQAFKLSKDLRKWEKSISIDINEINGDNEGVVGQRLADFARSTAHVYDQIMLDELLSNPTCYDGGALLANAHGNVGTGGTADNLTTSALSFSEVETAQQALGEMKNVNSEPLNARVTHILCGPQQERVGMEVTGSDRPVAISTAGGQHATTGVTTSVLLHNFIGGPINLMISHRITGNEWFAMDLSRGQRKPMFLAEFQSPQATTLDRADDAPIFYRDQAEFSIVAKATPMAGDWHLIYGSVSA